MVVGMVKPPAECDASHEAHAIGRDNCGFSFLAPCRFDQGLSIFRRRANHQCEVFSASRMPAHVGLRTSHAKRWIPEESAASADPAATPSHAVRTTGGFTSDSENCCIARTAKSNGTNSKQSKLSFNRTVASSDRSQGRRAYGIELFALTKGESIQSSPVA
jgi:hypothetical protein